RSPPLALLILDSRSLASSGRSLGRIKFFFSASCCSWLSAWVWSFTIICANLLTWGLELFWATTCPNSTSALLPLAASMTKCWSELLKELSLWVLVVSVLLRLLGAPPAPLLSALQGSRGL